MSINLHLNEHKLQESWHVPGGGVIDEGMMMREFWFDGQYVEQEWTTHHYVVQCTRSVFLSMSFLVFDIGTVVTIIPDNHSQDFR